MKSASRTSQATFLWKLFCPSRFLTASLAIAVCTPVAYSQSLNEFIQSGVRKNPTMLAAREGVRSERETLFQARSNFLPSVNFEADLSTADRNARLQDGTEFSDSTSPSSASIVLDQPLYTGGFRNALSARARLSVDLAEANYQAQELQLALDIADAYFALWRAHENLKIEIEYQRLVEDQLLAAKERSELGSGTLTEIAQVEAKLSMAHARLATAREQTIRSRDRLEALSQLDAIDIPVIRLEAGESEVDLERLIKLARDFSPELRSQNLTTRLERMNALASDRQNGPQLSLRLRASTSRETSPAVDRDDDLRASLYFSMPLYDGGRSKSEVRASLARRRQSDYNAQTIALDLENQIEALVTEMEIAELQMVAYRDAIEANRKVLEGLEEGKAIGLWSTQDVLDATEGLIEARLQFLDATYQAQLAQAQIVLLTGQF